MNPKQKRGIAVVAPSDETLPRSPARLYWRKFVHAGAIDHKNLEKYSIESTGFPFEHVGDLARSAEAFTHYRDQNRVLLGSPAFWQAFRNAEIIYLLDPYFDDVCYSMLLNQSSLALRSNDGARQDITVFTEKSISNHMLQAAADDLRKHATIALFRFRDVGLSSSKDARTGIHDRIALFDRYIWHCGATIGGMYPHVSALSGAWLDEQGQLRRFFERLVDKGRSARAGKNV